MILRFAQDDKWNPGDNEKKINKKKIIFRYAESTSKETPPFTGSPVQ